MLRSRSLEEIFGEREREDIHTSSLTLGISTGVYVCDQWKERGGGYKSSVFLKCKYECMGVGVGGLRGWGVVEVKLSI